MPTELLESGVTIDDLEGAADGHERELVSKCPWGSFVAIDLIDGRQIVGTLRSVEWDEDFEETVVELTAPNGAALTERVTTVAKVWHAPMGYRAGS